MKAEFIPHPNFPNRNLNYYSKLEFLDNPHRLFMIDTTIFEPNIFPDKIVKNFKSYYDYLEELLFEYFSYDQLIAINKNKTIELWIESSKEYPAYHVKIRVLLNNIEKYIDNNIESIIFFKYKDMTQWLSSNLPKYANFEITDKVKEYFNDNKYFK